MIVFELCAVVVGIGIGAYTHRVVDQAIKLRGELLGCGHSGEKLWREIVCYSIADRIPAADWLYDLPWLFDRPGNAPAFYRRHVNRTN
jgi:hypothetical protein